MYPLFSDHLKRFGEACRHIIIPELNFSGQFANLVAPHLNCRVERFNRVTGLPFPAEDIFDRIKESAP
jgi:2-oxoglutarate ferredoxin oxidoreductase subunit alpha